MQQWAFSYDFHIECFLNTNLILLTDLTTNIQSLLEVSLIKTLPLLWKEMKIRCNPCRNGAQIMFIRFTFIITIQRTTMRKIQHKSLKSYLKKLKMAFFGLSASFSTGHSSRNFSDLYGMWKEHFVYSEHIKSICLN